MSGQTTPFCIPLCNWCNRRTIESTGSDLCGLKRFELGSRANEYQKPDEGLSIRGSAHMRDGSTTWKDLTMTNFKLLGVAAILSTMIATPVMAQQAVQEPGAHACYESF